jgi:hypothetical protein
MSFNFLWMDFSLDHLYMFFFFFVLFCKKEELNAKTAFEFFEL